MKSFLRGARAVVSSLVVVAAVLLPSSPARAVGASFGCNKWAFLQNPALPPMTYPTGAARAGQGAWVTGTDSQPSGKFTAAHFDGSVWDTTVTLNLPGPSYQSHNAVATATGEVWAVGTYQNGPYDLYGTTLHGFAAHFDGTSWSLVEPPYSPLGNTLEAVAAGPAGMFFVGVTSLGPTVYRWSGSDLAVVPGLDVATRQLPTAFTPAGVIVAGATVWVVGEWFDYGPTGVQSHVTAFRWDGGGTWTQTPMPDLVAGPTAYGLVYGAAAAGNTPLVVGKYSDHVAHVVRPMILRWDGAAWMLEPTDAAWQSLRGVVDDGAGGAWAVGEREDGRYRQTAAGRGALAMHWNGVTWTDSSPAPSDDFPIFDGVAAVDPTHVFTGTAFGGASFLPRGGC